MKKFFLTAVCGLLTLSSFAQSAVDGSSDKEKVTFGIRAGLNVSYLGLGFSDKYADYFDGGTSKCGYNVGVILDIPVVSRYFYVQPGLFLTQKGASLKYEDNEYEGYEKVSVNPTYLEIPILLSGRYDITDKIQVQVNFGPYFAVGMFGKYKYVWSVGDYSDEYSEKLFVNDNENGYGPIFKRFDAGLSFGAGFTFAKHFYVGFQYELGLANIAGDDLADIIKIKNRNCMIGIGYNF